MLVVKSNYDDLNINTVTGDIETMLISIHLKEMLPIYIVGVYRHPSGKIDNDIKKCEYIIESTYKLPKGRRSEIMLLGDVNIDLLTNNRYKV